ncbi:matrix protein [Maize sterile stunt virus]|nr:matrix protein [Maize sterile stunt virus]
MSRVTRFLFLKLDVEMEVDFGDGVVPISISQEVLQLLLEKSDVPADMRPRIIKLLLWVFDESRAGRHTRIQEKKVSSIYIPRATRYTYCCPNYLMIRYHGLPFPQVSINAERQITQEVNNETRSIFRVKLKPLQIKEITHNMAADLLDENSGYLLPTTYHEEDKKK